MTGPIYEAEQLFAIVPGKARQRFHVSAEEIEGGFWISWCGKFLDGKTEPLDKTVAMQAETLEDMPCPVCRRCFSELEEA